MDLDPTPAAQSRRSPRPAACEIGNGFVCAHRGRKEHRGDDEQGDHIDNDNRWSAARHVSLRRFHHMSSYHSQSPTGPKTVQLARLDWINPTMRLGVIGASASVTPNGVNAFSTAAMIAAIAGI